MGKLQFLKADGTILDYSTPSIDIVKNIPTTVRVSLWEGVGQRIALDKVKELGLEVQYIPDQTKARKDYEMITFMYTNIVEFPTRVTELKEKYDFLGVEYNCTVEDIATAIKSKFESVDEQATFLAEFNSLLDKGVKLNYQAGMRLYRGYTDDSDVDPVVDDFIMWTDFPKLVKWLPGTYTEAEIPPRREVEIIANAEREAEILAEIASDYQE